MVRRGGGRFAWSEVIRALQSIQSNDRRLQQPMIFSGSLAQAGSHGRQADDVLYQLSAAARVSE